nr:uncharacterized protein LOC117274062 isoform X1 [Nicotiana tomentosiformis]
MVFSTKAIMVRSRGRGDTSKGRGESSRGRGKGNNPLGVQSKVIAKKLTIGRGRAIEPSESSSYAPSRESFEGQSMEVQHEAQSQQPQPTGRYQLHKKSFTTTSSSEGSDVNSQGSEPSYTPTPPAPVAIDDDDDDDGRGGDTRVGGLERSKKKEAWEDRFVSLTDFTRFRDWWTQRSLTLERLLLMKGLDKYNPNVLRQFRERKWWMRFTQSVINANEHLVLEFYANVAHIKKGTKITKVRNLKSKFDPSTLNTYLSFEEVEAVKYLEKLVVGDAALPWLAEILATRGPSPSWITVGVPILRATLNFEAKGWQTFVCSCIDLSRNKNNLPLPRAVLVASIMAGYPINVGAIMSANMTIAVQKSESSYPYPNTL